jgi:uncharacterized protein YndB with AHSA1/START domain
MTDTLSSPAQREIVVEEHFPHAPEVIWKALTTGELIARWLMPPTGFQAVEGTEFTYQTTPAGAWDGVIRCRVLEVRPNERLVYSWAGGHEGNTGYGSRLETVVTWTLSPAEGGARVRLVHAGFLLPTNATAFESMTQGWSKVVRTLEDLLGEEVATQH